MTRLARFYISPRDDDFLLQLEGEDGAHMALILTAEQLDAFAERADELLDLEDEVSEVEGDTYQKPLG